MMSIFSIVDWWIILSDQVLELHLRPGEVLHDGTESSHGIMFRDLFFWRCRSNMLRSDQSKMSSMADPQRVGLNTIPHLVADHGAGASPSIMLTSATAFHLGSGTLCLPVVHLRAGQVDLMSA